MRDGFYGGLGAASAAGMRLLRSGCGRRLEADCRGWANAVPVMFTAHSVPCTDGSDRRSAPEGQPKLWPGVVRRSVCG